EGRWGAGCPGGRKFSAAPQVTYSAGANAAKKTPYRVRPPPDLAGTPNAQSPTRPPSPSVAFVAAIDPALAPADLVLLTTGASGLSSQVGVDIRVTNATTLANDPFQLTGPTLPY